MAKLALVLRQKKRVKTVAKYKARRTQLLEIIYDVRASEETKEEARLKLQKLPRVRDFRGVSPRGFDGRGNFTMGVKEQIIFPEIEYDKIDSIKGMNISIVTTAATDAEGRALLTHLGMPFRQPAPTATPGAAA